MSGWLEAVMLAALLAGLTGGLHCAAMCGGIVGLLKGASSKHEGTPAHWRLAAAYHAGRLLSYTLAGVLAGSAGQAGLLWRGSLPVQQVTLLAASLTLCLMALYLAGVSPWMRSLEAAGAVLWRRVEPLARHMLPVDGVAKALGLGMLWGWLPCGMVYAVLLLALSTGAPGAGGAVMFAFGIGTLPNVLLIESLSNPLRRAVKQRGARWAVAAMLSAIGLYGLMHAAHPDAAQLGDWLCRIVP